MRRQRTISKLKICIAWYVERLVDQTDELPLMYFFFGGGFETSTNMLLKLGPLYLRPLMASAIPLRTPPSQEERHSWEAENEQVDCLRSILSA